MIIDEVGPTVAKGRSKGDAPEIDGAVYVQSHRPLRVGEIATVKIERDRRLRSARDRGRVLVTREPHWSREGAALPSAGDDASERATVGAA